jgi:hypothetical protein
MNDDDDVTSSRFTGCLLLKRGWLDRVRRRQRKKTDLSASHLEDKSRIRCLGRLGGGWMMGQEARQSGRRIHSDYPFVTWKVHFLTLGPLDLSSSSRFYAWKIASHFLYPLSPTRFPSFLADMFLRALCIFWNFTMILQ